MMTEAQEKTLCEVLLDETPITREWLASIGFKPVTSDMGPEYADHMELDSLNVWGFNETGWWLFNPCDSIELRTRGELQMLAYLLNNRNRHEYQNRRNSLLP